MTTPTPGETYQGTTPGRQAWRVASVDARSVYVICPDSQVTGRMTLPTWDDWVRRHMAVRVEDPS